MKTTTGVLRIIKKALKTLTKQVRTIGKLTPDFLKKPFRMLPPQARRASVFVVGFAAIAAVLLLVSRAATPFVSLQPEQGSIAGNACSVPASGASGQAVQFGNCSTPTPPPAGTAVIDASRTIGTSKAQLSTQLVYHGILPNIPNGQSRLNALKMPLIRIHAGTDAVYPGSGPELPEGVTKGDWSFAELNELVDDIKAAGTKPVLNVRYAPDWMWTCTSYFDGGSAGNGTLRDQTYNEFADYMARLVSYYNKGSMVTEAGVTITNPVGTANRIDQWEIWNEPDLANETPCHPSDWSAPLTPANYTKMWNVVAPKMKAVDSTIKLAGPVVSNPPYGSGNQMANYFTTLMSTGNPTPDILTFHSYGWWENTGSDSLIFDGDNSEPGCCQGVGSISTGLDWIHAKYPGIPVYLTEENVNSDWGDDPKGRPWGALGVAWGASVYRALVLHGADLTHQYEFSESLQFGYVDQNTGTPYLPYWRDIVLSQSIPPGSTILYSASYKNDIETLAVKRTDGSIAVLVINRQIDTSKDGVGLPANITVNVSGITPSSVKLRKIDANTSAANGPATQSLSNSTSIPLSFGGYGMAIIELTP